MRALTIEPFIGVGELKFGMTRGEVRSLLPGKAEPFSRIGGERKEVDDFPDLALQASFDEADRLEFIEMYPPATPRFAGVEMIGRKASAVVQDLAALGFAAVEVDAGLDFSSCGFGLYAPHEVVEAASAYRRGYYDS